MSAIAGAYETWLGAVLLGQYVDDGSKVKRMIDKRANVRNPQL
jgi:hypothetical protein